MTATQTHCSHGMHVNAFHCVGCAEEHEAAKARCSSHPAYEADYCPSCGTSRQIGGAR